MKRLQRGEILTPQDLKDIKDDLEWVSRKGGYVPVKDALDLVATIEKLQDCIVGIALEF